jgi:hypothetical protein
MLAIAPSTLMRMIKLGSRVVNLLNFGRGKGDG